MVFASSSSSNREGQESSSNEIACVTGLKFVPATETPGKRIVSTRHSLEASKRFRMLAAKVRDRWCTA